MDSASLIVAPLQFSHLFLAICTGEAETGRDRLGRYTHRDACALSGSTQYRDSPVHAKQSKSGTDSRAEGAMVVSCVCSERKCVIKPCGGQWGN